MGISYKVQEQWQLFKGFFVYLQTGTAARFDFEGNLVTSDEGIDVKLGLHHHGNEPEVRNLLMLHVYLLVCKTLTAVLHVLCLFVVINLEVITYGTLLSVESWLLAGGVVSPV